MLPVACADRLWSGEPGLGRWPAPPITDAIRRRGSPVATAASDVGAQGGAGHGASARLPARRARTHGTAPAMDGRRRGGARARRRVGAPRAAIADLSGAKTEAEAPRRRLAALAARRGAARARLPRRASGAATRSHLAARATARGDGIRPRRAGGGGAAGGRVRAAARALPRADASDRASTSTLGYAARAGSVRRCRSSRARATVVSGRRGSARCVVATKSRTRLQGARRPRRCRAAPPPTRASQHGRRRRVLERPASSRRRPWTAMAPPTSLIRARRRLRRCGHAGRRSGARAREACQRPPRRGSVPAARQPVRGPDAAPRGAGSGSPPPPLDEAGARRGRATRRPPAPAPA